MVDLGIYPVESDSFSVVIKDRRIISVTKVWILNN